MGHLYRTPVMVRYKQPFVDWIVSLGDMDPESVTMLRGDTHVYLVHVTEREMTLEEVVSEYWPDIFEEELYGWMTDESTWPADRTPAMFSDWFAVDLATSVIDLVPGEPLTDDEMDAADVEAARRIAHRAGKTLDLIVRDDVH